jgi:RHS repeat-associated protein
VNDKVGNRYPTSNVYNAANQLLENDNYIYSYDKNGNTIKKVSKADNSGVRYYWNAENQMTKLEKYAQAGDATPTSTVSYIYDGLGRRVAKNINGVITKYIYDQEDILLESDDNDNILARYTHGPGIDEPISMNRDGQSYYYVADGLRSIVKLVDTVGTVVNNYVYDSFGNMVEKTEGVTNPYTYTAREFDAESGLYYYRARYYNAKIGRFLSEDPVSN